MNRTNFIWLWSLASLVYILGLGVGIKDVNSAQYAALSREMLETGQFFKLQLYGEPYLDKPPLLFWINTLFFNAFGYANWSFKIGSFLFSTFGAYGTFRTAKLLYNAATGRLAALILYTSQAFFLLNNVVRTDTVLLACVIIAIWQMLEWLYSHRWKWLLGASVFLALAMLAKGMVGLVVPLMAVGCYLLGKRRWQDFLRWQYLVGLGVIFLVISPYLWGLHQQFDLQPEQGIMVPTSGGMQYRTDVSGLKHFFWTQGVARLTGDSGWSDATGPLYFTHSFLWSFMPWSLFFAGAFLWQVRRIFKAFLENSALPELLTIGGFALPFIGFSMLSYKLPHYLYVLFPLTAILTAHWWEHTWRKLPGQRWRSLATASQLIIWLAIAGVCYLVFFRFFSGAAWWQWLTCLLLLLGALPFTLLGYRHKYRLITASVMGSVALNYCLNAWLFPNWLNYQAGERLIDQIENRRMPKSSIYPYHFYSYSFHYHMGYTEVPEINDAEIEKALKENQTIYLVTRDPYLQDVRSDFKSDIIFQMSSHHMKGLSMKFLNPDTRMETLNQVYLVKILAPKQESP